MQLKKLIESMEDVQLIEKDNGKEVKIKSLNTDSRKKTENSLFFCLVGENVDSHTLVEEAVQNGAVAVVTERRLETDVPQILVDNSRFALGKLSSVFYGEPSKKLKVIGITGTNGKTTTAHMLFSILKKAGKKTGIIGTLGVRYAGIKLPASLTTPDPIELQKTFADMQSKGIEYVVMEVSAHALYYQKTTGVEFSVCIFTNFTQDHLDFFHTMKAYKQAKSRLFDTECCPLAILNADDEVGREFAKARIEGKTVTYALNTPSDCFAVITDETLYKTECMLNINDKLCRISLALAGEHNVYNALAAAACAFELGIENSAITSGLNELERIEGRLERVSQSKGAEIFVDFAHTPDGLEKSLEALRRFCKGRLICLFGCGGNRDKEKRPLMGKVVAKKADFGILTSDNPRYEDPLDIISEVEKGYRRFSVRYVIVPDRKRAIEYALEFLKRGDILLVAGKGGEEYQEIMGIKHPYKDQDIIEKIIKRTDKK